MMLEWEGLDQLWRLRIPSLLCSRARGQSTRPSQKDRIVNQSQAPHVTIRLIIFVSHEGNPQACRDAVRSARLRDNAARGISAGSDKIMSPKFLH